MPDLFGIDIAGILSDAVGADGMPAATLHKKTAGTRTAGKVLSGTNPANNDYSTVGIISSFKKKFVKGTNTIISTHKILLIGKALNDAGVEPEDGDKITIESGTYNVIEVTRDPAAATFEVYVVGV